MTDFISDVAERTGATEQRVEAVLSEYGVPTASPPATRRGLTVERLKFSGTKTIEERDDEPFVFEQVFAPGVWCVTSRQNLAGKSSVLNMILWALRGRPGGLRADVRDWLDRVELDAIIDGEAISVRYDVVDGSPRGELVRRGEPEVLIASFETHDAFERAMAGFMMDRLRLDPTPFWRRRPNDPEERGDRGMLGWQAYASALYIPEASYGAVLGEQTISGQAGILLQVFVGVPWTATYHAARVAQNRASQQVSVGQAAVRDAAAARGGRREEIEALLVAARASLEALPEAPDAGQIDEAVHNYQRIAERQGALASEAAECQRELEAADVLAVEDEQQLLDIRESLAARPFFAKLNPSRCPRCEHDLGPERSAKEAETLHCAVCDSVVTDSDEEDGAERLAMAEEQVVASREYAAATRERCAALSAEVASVTAEAETLRAQVDELTAAPAQLAARQQQEREISRLEGMLEHDQDVEQTLTAAAAPDEDIAAILRAATEEANERSQTGSRELFEALAAEVVDLGRAFGMANLEAVALDRAAHMRVTTGGTSTAFSNLTNGEKLRLKIAVVIALLRLGEQQGVGRHPGLLLIDSPGREEMIEHDVSEILAQLRRLTDELPHLQVITASAQYDAVAAVLEPDRLVAGTGEGEVW